MAQLTKIGIAGDWHGDTLWAKSAIQQMSKRLELEDQPYPMILQLGDFGYWESDNDYIATVSDTLVEEGALLDFIDGNHENHRLLKQCQEAEGNDFVGIYPNIYWLTRGYRWEWFGRTWLACGGGVSVDQNRRKEGVSWFPEEEITWKQAAEIISDGRADVMITHDCPAFYEPYDKTNPFNFKWELINKSREHAHRLQDIVDEVRPSHLYHGHYHTCYQKTVTRDWGDIQLTGLDCNGSQMNWGILDIETMEFHL